MIYDIIIIGAGAAGLFAGASLPSPQNGLILEKSASPGKKLLLSGGGQCNITHNGSIKDFILHYGDHGKKIRSVLYRFNNQSVMDFFAGHQFPLFEREDGKVFPSSLKAQDVLDLLLNCCNNNGITILYNSPVTKISYREDTSSPVYTVSCDGNQYMTRKLVVAAGGCSYPATGSDGSLLSVLKELDIELVPSRPSLMPVYVQDYPYGNLSGISFSSARITLYDSFKGDHQMASSFSDSKIAENTDALLFTHSGFSGPGILNISRYAEKGQQLSINYYPKKNRDAILKDLTKAIPGNKKQLLTVLYEYFNKEISASPAELPYRFLESVCLRCQLNTQQKYSQISGSQLKSLVSILTEDTFLINRLGGFETAMATAGGVSLDEVNLKTLESNKYPNLFFAGEILDVDGDTGGYNLQFAFSSGYLAAQ
ncbi:NAD(P)/FAD-dependent oxidoreductase [Sinanaerobacter chloroacetimidivorans]|uniref:Aminoacetone oxidase family FAD-binding enzyme n=1 Tax=Sinanaerobacter chloroacetimidivorans TaxID=2818044 RepID=A0A8J7W044_9FIRM|nr:aminoacetone oxidase family FAD-binding enzyme [Sinanaerobacter chloroacetimidivorans]MBR0596805.1 aminoacetone oxidase family FAD-binding enzyme [Sinanaerobacter chloroacetimidivorans]